MRVLRHFIPLDNIACTVRTERRNPAYFHIGVGSWRLPKDDFSALWQV